jgi:hypothetical protein
MRSIDLKDQSVIATAQPKLREPDAEAIIKTMLSRALDEQRSMRKKAS